MAKAELVGEPLYTLTLSKTEAEVLMILTANVAGDGVARGATSNIYSALRGVGLNTSFDKYFTKASAESKQ